MGRIYMAASGAPDRTEHHAKNIADVSLHLIKRVRSLKLASGLDIQIRIGNRRFELGTVCRDNALGLTYATKAGWLQQQPPNPIVKQQVDYGIWRQEI